MDLKNFTKHLIYQSANTQIPDNFSRFQILHPEYSAHESVVKTYPLPENEHLFSLLWDIHDGHMLSATILPSQPSFLYEKEFEWEPMRTQFAWTITGLCVLIACSRASVMAFIESKTSFPLQWMMRRFLKPEKLSATLRLAV